MKILFLYQYFDLFGGAEKISLDLHQYLSAKGYNCVTAAAFINENGLGERKEQVKVIPLSKHTSRGKSLFGLVEWVRIICRLRKVLKDVDLVVAQNYPTQIWAYGAVLFLRKKPVVLWICHEAFRAFYPKLYAPFVEKMNPPPKKSLKESLFPYYRFLQRFLDRYCGKKMDLILYNSKFCKRLFRPVYTPAKMEVCYLGIDFGDNPECKKEQDGCLRILSVGRLFPIKNFTGCVRAVRILKDQYQFKQWKYYIVGQGPEEVLLRQLVEEYGLTDHVVICGFVSHQELVKMYQTADLFLSVQYSETFGLTFLEAARYTLPSVGPSDGGPNEIIDHEETGLLVPPEKPDDIAENIYKILTDHEKRIQMGENAKKRYWSFFTTKHFIDRFDAILKRY